MNSDTQKANEYFSNLANKPLIPFEFKTLFPQADGEKLLEKLVICKDGFIRTR